MSCSRRGAWALVGPCAWLLGGCAIDLLVGEAPSGNEASTSSSTADPTAAPSSTGSTMQETDAPATTESGTTTHDEGTSTGPIMEGTSTGPTLEGTSTTGEIDCNGLGFADCTELPHCLWYGSPKVGECAPSPCEDLRHECFSLPYEDCQAAFPCAWVGEPEVGECGPIECVPCEVLGNDQCMETPTCVWDEGEMFCLPA